MNHSTNTPRRSLCLATLCLIASALFTSATFAQPSVTTPSNCFTVTFGTATHNCASGQCGGPQDPATNRPCADYDCPPICNIGCAYQPCSTHCTKVTICSNCPGFTKFKITCPNYDQIGNCRSYCPDSLCHNVGGPGNPSDAGDYCSWQGPREIAVDNPLGMPNGGCISFIICEAYTTAEEQAANPFAPPVTYNISCTPSNCNGGAPCTDAVITW
jgi:hypothetical protein